MRGYPLPFEPSDEARHVVGVRIDLAKYRRLADRRRPEAPVAIRGIFRIDRGSGIADGECNVDHAHSPDRSVFDQGARLTRHGESGIAMREAKDAIFAVNEANQLPGFCQIARHRLFADDVDSALKKRLGDRKMELRRGRDDDRIDPVGTLGLALQHHSPIRVRPPTVDHLRLRRG